MILNLQQYVKEESCLNCDGCCRFSDQNSKWAPVFTKDEIRILRSQAKPDSEFSKFNAPKLRFSEGVFICPFFSQKDKRCLIYSIRPFDCRLYPFILTRKAGNKIFLATDKKCPLVRDKMESEEFKKYSQYLKGIFSSKEGIKFVSGAKDFIPSLVEDLVFISEIKLD